MLLVGGRSIAPRLPRSGDIRTSRYPPEKSPKERYPDLRRCTGMRACRGRRDAGSDSGTASTIYYARRARRQALDLQPEHVSRLEPMREAGMERHESNAVVLQSGQARFEIQSIFGLAGFRVQRSRREDVRIVFDELAAFRFRSHQAFHQHIVGFEPVQE